MNKIKSKKIVHPLQQQKKVGGGKNCPSIPKKGK
jgi:hypothetical protein